MARVWWLLHEFVGTKHILYLKPVLQFDACLDVDMNIICAVVKGIIEAS